MALVGNHLYVANTDSLMRFPYQEGKPILLQPVLKYWTYGWASKPPLDQNIIANREGTKLYITVGSNSNVAENGLDQEKAVHKLWSLILQVVIHVHLQQDCVIQMVWLGNLKVANFGQL